MIDKVTFGLRSSQTGGILPETAKDMRFVACSLILFLVFFVVNCGREDTSRKDTSSSPLKELDVTERTSWAYIQKKAPEVSASYSWRFIGWNKTAAGRIVVDGAYRITLYNPTKEHYDGGIVALHFWDAKGYQIATCKIGEKVGSEAGYPEIVLHAGERFTLPQQGRVLLTGNFSIELASLDAASSITSMTLELVELLNPVEYVQYLKLLYP